MGGCVHLHRSGQLLGLLGQHRELSRRLVFHEPVEESHADVRAVSELFGSLALAAAVFFKGAFAAVVVGAIPLLVLGGLYHVGHPEPRLWALRSVIGLPLLTALVCGAYPGWRAMHRQDDGNYGMRVVEGNGGTLVWAPEGPGRPSHYASWWEAKRRCRYLAADGRSLAGQPQNLWRLPTVDEAVRPMVYRGHNAGGVWSAALRRPQYRVMPDKDAPLWKVHSPVIYWWTDTEAAPTGPIASPTTATSSPFLNAGGETIGPIAVCANRPSLPPATSESSAPPCE